MEVIHRMLSNWKIYEYKSLLRKIIFFCIPSSTQRVQYIYKHNIFAECGHNLFFQPRKLPADPKFIKFHNNVVVAADVTFINHDVLYILFRNMYEETIVQHIECIEVMDNVFIGLGATIMPGVTIGPNAIVAAGSVVTKDVQPGTIVGGCPAKAIGRFDDLYLQRKKESEELLALNLRDKGLVRASYAWKRFSKKIDNPNNREV